MASVSASTQFFQGDLANNNVVIQGSEVKTLIVEGEEAVSSDVWLD
jgi:hypothetical protein